MLLDIQVPRFETERAKAAVAKLGTVKDVIETMNCSYIFANVPGIDAPADFVEPLRKAMDNYRGLMAIKESVILG